MPFPGHLLSVLLLAHFVAGQAPSTVRVAVILSTGTSLPYDYSVLAPAIQAAFDKSLTDYNIQYVPVLSLYPGGGGGRGGGCSTSGAAGETFKAINSSVDLIIGPACTDDMKTSLEYQTFFNVPSITGGGELADSVAKYLYATRCAYSTYTQWLFLIRIFTQFNWTNIAVIYDGSDATKIINANSLMKNIRAVRSRYYEIKVRGRSVREPDQAQSYLKEASKNSRVVVLIMSGIMTRTFMIGARELGYTSGEYAFFGLDTFRDDTLGSNGWKQDDRYDDEAQDAFGALFVLTLRDTSKEPRYLDFANKVTDAAQRLFPLSALVINYYSATFYDSIILYAKSFNETLEEGHSIGLDNVMEVSQKAWNRTFPGATGMVYINSEGDRLDDHSLYDLDEKGVFRVVASFFGYKEDQVDNYYYDAQIPFDWNSPGNVPPPNEPRCGYRGEKKICDKTGQTLGISLGVVGVVLVSGLLAGGIAYSIIHRRSELAQLNVLGTWEEITKAQTAMIKVTRKKDPDFSSHTSLDPRGLMDNVNNINANNQTVNATFRGVRVMLRVCEREMVHMSATLREVKAVRAIQSDNVAELAGLCTGPYRVAVMYSYCAKGSLSDLLATEIINLDWLFRFSLIKDFVNGLLAITTSSLGSHGRLTSLCIFVDDHFVAKVGDYGLPSFFARSMPASQDSAFCSSLLWTAPERLPSPFAPGTPESDVYSLAIVLSEVVMRERPYSTTGLEPEVIIAKLQKKHHKAFRPRIDGNACPPEISVMIKQCWAFNPLERPRLPQIKSIIKESEKNNSEKGTILDNLIRRMENYALDLEGVVEEKALQFKAEKEKTEELLYQILPRTVVDQLKNGVPVQPENFDSVTVLYSDIVDFTTLSSNSSPNEVVDLLNDLYSSFDNLIMKFDAYKVETVGDCYVVASGVPDRNGNKHAGEICRLALQLMELIKDFRIRHRPNEQLRARIGANTGPCVAGVVGLVMPRFCLFGEAVIIAAKMESSSRPMRIQISQACETLLQTLGLFETEQREDSVIVNEKLEITTFWLIREIL